MDVAAICALVTLLVLLASILVKLSATLARLDTSVKELAYTLHEQKKKTDHITNAVSNHEGRISVIEEHIGLGRTKYEN